jgi:hypothetical protein
MIFLKRLDFSQKMMEQLPFIGNITRTKVLGEARAEYIAIKTLQIFLPILVTHFQQA